MSNDLANIIAILKFFFGIIFLGIIVMTIRNIIDSILPDSHSRKRRHSNKQKSYSKASKFPPRSNEYFNKSARKGKRREEKNRTEVSPLEYKVFNDILLKQKANFETSESIGYVNKSARKGEWGEQKDRMELSRLSSDYKVLHDLLIPYKNWNLDYSQIDHVVTSIYGIFIIEAKNYTGEISGDEDGDWYQNNRPIKNPLKQNERHVNAIKALMFKHGYKNLLVHNIVTLNSRCNMNQVTSHSVVPDLYLQNLIEKRSKQIVLTMEQVEKIHDLLDKANIKDKSIRERHIQQTKAIASNDAYTCVLCGKKVTIGIRDFCLANPERFRGKIYCMEHQNQLTNQRTFY